MVLIRKLEKMLEPHLIDWGASSQYTMYNVYRRDGVTVRVDGWDIKPFGNMSYRQALEEAARKLELI